MWHKTDLAQMLAIKYPIIQAPMAGATTPELVACVSQYGGLGSLGAGYLSPSQLQSDIRAVRRLTHAPFSVNLFVPEEHEASFEQMNRACSAVNACARELDIEIKPIDGPYAPSFEQQVEVVIAEKVPIVSFTFGIPDSAIIRALKEAGIYSIGTATTVEEAVAIEQSELDAIVLQGSEAGGHRGSFIKKAEESLVTLEQLIAQSSQVIAIPVIAAGGIMTGQEIVNLLKLGVSAVQIGTAFLACPESGIPECYKQKLLSNHNDTTVLTRAFSGKLARGLANRFTQCMALKSDDIVPYPIQNKLTLEMRNHAKGKANTDYLSLWAGQSSHRVRAMKATQLFHTLVDEANLCGN